MHMSQQLKWQNGDRSKEEEGRKSDRCAGEFSRQGYNRETLLHMTIEIYAQGENNA